MSAEALINLLWWSWAIPTVLTLGPILDPDPPRGTPRPCPSTMSGEHVWGAWNTLPNGSDRWRDCDPVRGHRGAQKRSRVAQRDAQLRDEPDERGCGWWKHMEGGEICRHYPWWDCPQCDCGTREKRAALDAALSPPAPQDRHWVDHDCDVRGCETKEPTP